jgi:hypothetical protein
MARRRKLASLPELDHPEFFDRLPGLRRLRP